MSIPVVNIVSQTVKKISDETGKSQCVCEFVVDQDSYKWESRALKGNENPKLGVGTLVESGGFLKKGEKSKVIIDYNELKSGDGLYTVSIYAQNLDGFWSDGSYYNIYVGAKYNTKKSFNSRRKFNCKIYD